MTDDGVLDDLHGLTGAYALDALTDEERAAFEAHLESCDACVIESTELIATAAQLAWLVEEPAPDRLRAAVLSEATRTPQLAPLAAPEEPTQPASVTDLDARRTSRRRWVAAVACGLAAAAAIATALVVIDNDDPIDDVLAADDARTVVGEVEGGGSATLVVSATEDAAVITFAGLPDPGAGRAYQMWLIDGDAAPMPEDTFQPADGTASVLLEDAPDVDAVAVTVEPSSGSTEPTLPILAVIEIGA